MNILFNNSNSSTSACEVAPRVADHGPHFIANGSLSLQGQGVGGASRPSSWGLLPPKGACESPLLAYVLTRAPKLSLCVLLRFVFRLCPFCMSLCLFFWGFRENTLFTSCWCPIQWSVAFCPLWLDI